VCFYLFQLPELARTLSAGGPVRETPMRFLNFFFSWFFRFVSFLFFSFPKANKRNTQTPIFLSVSHRLFVFCVIYLNHAQESSRSINLRIQAMEQEIASTEEVCPSVWSFNLVFWVFKFIQFVWYWLCLHIHVACCRRFEWPRRR
jgi:hypothetical protein